MIYLYDFLEVPDEVKAASKSPAMKRLLGVEMNCGMNYTSFPLFRDMRPYTRYEHSIGTALLVHHFTHRTNETLAALFHDISTPVFSHVVDFMNGDHMVQESTEERTAALIQDDPVIQLLLGEHGLRVSEVADYHQYPVADNESPKLSCDRLEYTLGNAVNYGFEDIAFVKETVNDLVIAENEEGEAELAFQTGETALNFAYTALRCGKIYSGRENRFAMETLARILKDAVNSGILRPEDLYTEESRVIRLLEESELKGRWDAFRSYTKVITGSEEDGLNLDAKRRCIDPLVCGEGRVSSIDPAFAREMMLFQEESYDEWLKGVING